MRWSLLIRSLALAAPALAAAREGAAQPAASPALIVANDLYEQAVDAMKRRDFDAACPKLEEVVRLKPDGVGAKLTLASCYEAGGRLASAWSTYLLAEAAAARAEQPARQRLARERAEALRPRLARLSLALPDATRALPGLRITCDGVPLPATQWDAPFPVDRGAHRIAATADGRRPWEGGVEVELDGVTVEVEIGALPAEPRDPEASTGARRAAQRAPALPPRGAAGPGRAPPLEAEARWSTQALVGSFLCGFGALGLGAGALAGAIAITKRDASDEAGRCNENDVCDAQGASLRAESRLAGTLSTGAFIAGAVTIAGGITLFATGGRSAPRAGARVTVGPSRISVHGVW